MVREAPEIKKEWSSVANGLGREGVLGKAFLGEGTPGLSCDKRKRYLG